MIQWRWQVKKMTTEIYLAAGRHKNSRGASFRVWWHPHSRHEPGALQVALKMRPADSSAAMGVRKAARAVSVRRWGTFFSLFWKEGIYADYGLA